MRIHWFRKEGESETAFLETEQEMPREGTTVYFRDYTADLKSGLKPFKCRVIRADQTLVLNRMSLESIKPELCKDEPEQRYEEMVDLILVKTGGIVQKLITDSFGEKFVTYALAEGEVVVEKVD